MPDALLGYFDGYARRCALDARCRARGYRLLSIRYFSHLFGHLFYIEDDGRYMIDDMRRFLRPTGAHAPMRHGQASSRKSARSIQMMSSCRQFLSLLARSMRYQVLLRNRPLGYHISSSLGRDSLLYCHTTSRPLSATVPSLLSLSLFPRRRGSYATPPRARTCVIGLRRQRRCARHSREGTGRYTRRRHRSSFITFSAIFGRWLGDCSAIRSLRRLRMGAATRRHGRTDATGGIFLDTLKMPRYAGCGGADIMRDNAADCSVWPHANGRRRRKDGASFSALLMRAMALWRGAAAGDGVIFSDAT